MKRRATTLPEHTTAYEINGLRNIAEGSFTRAFRAEMDDIAAADAERTAINRQFWTAYCLPDPWDEAVRSIERRAAAKAERPFPW